jgi:ABC-type cobalamin transport system permease subunit
MPHVQKFNIMRPLLILAVAFLAKSLTNFICILLGASVELAGNLSFVAMMVAAILTYMRMNKTRNKR